MFMKLLKDMDEVLYLVDGNSYVHIEAAEEGFRYSVYGLDGGLSGSGELPSEEIAGVTGCVNFHALAAALLHTHPGKELGDISAARVSLKTLEGLRDARRAYRQKHLYEKDTYIRFIDPQYKDLFLLDDGGSVTERYKDGIDWPEKDREWSFPCKRIDDYHLYVGHNVFHICEFAERREAAGIEVSPEAEVFADAAAWAVRDGYLYVGLDDDLVCEYVYYGTDHLMISTGFFEEVGLTLLEARRSLMEKLRLGKRAQRIDERELLCRTADATQTERSLLVSAMDAAGRNYNGLESGPGFLVFNGDGFTERFDSWRDVRDWLEGVVFDDPEVSDAVEKILHPERFPKGVMV